MATRFINMQQADLNSIKQQALADFQAMLEKLSDTPEKLLDTISFREKYVLGPQNIQQQVIYITASAYLKMLTYVLTTEKELAWHGTVLTDLEKHPNKYFITDVFLYPQTVTGATVTTDQEKYNTWTQDLDDDTFNNMRFQGHSHVRMGVTPSGVDTTFYEDLVQNLHNGEFYIFMILNKSQDMYFRIYDTKNNIMYDKEDITVIVLDSDNENLIEDAKVSIKENISERTYQQYMGFRGTVSNPPHTGPKTIINSKNEKTRYLDGEMVTEEEYWAAMEKEKQDSLFNYYMDRDEYPTKNKSKKKK